MPMRLSASSIGCSRSPTRIPRGLLLSIRTLRTPLAFEALQLDGTLPETCLPRQYKCLNNMAKQEHRLVKRRVNPGLWFGAFAMAQLTIHGYEAMRRLRKGPRKGLARGGCPRTESGHQPSVRLGSIKRAHQPFLTRQSAFATLPIAVPEVGGLHHHYERQDA